MIRRVRVLTAFLLVCAITAAGCTGTPPPDPGPGPDSQVAAFAAEMGNGRIDLAADLTDAPDQADQLLSEVFLNLRPSELSVTPGPVTRTSPDSAESVATFSWAMPDGRWEYDAVWNWVRVEGQDPEWVLTWSPTVVHPQLAARQTLVARTTPSEPGLLTDRNGNQVVAPVRIFSVVLLPDQVSDLGATAARLQALLTPFDPSATAERILAEVADAQGEAESTATPGDTTTAGTTGEPSTAEAAGSSYTVTNLREEEYFAVQAQLAEITGLTFPSEVRTLPVTPDFARTMLGEVVSATEQLRAGKPAWRVVTVDTTGSELETLFEQPAVAGRSVTLTIDTSVQTAAERALAEVPKPAVVVAIQPSTGEILAVAQNLQADELGSIALTGQYPPGSTFKIVTATAALNRGVITGESDVPCPGTVFIEGREVNNGGFFDLGVVPVRQAIAQSCNTTFAVLASQMPADALTEAAKSYGIGLDFVIEGITTLTGQVPPASSPVQRAENGFGQGQVLLTPFSAAMMAATAAAGSMPVPQLIRGTTTIVDQPAPDRSPAVQRAVQELMRAVVEEGTGSLLEGLGDVRVKTGSAQYIESDGSDHTHAWTAGYRDDLAFAAFIVDGDNGVKAVELVKRFLELMPT